LGGAKKKKKANVMHDPLYSEAVTFFTNAHRVVILFLGNNW
jgi:hypothetical protein